MSRLAVVALVLLAAAASARAQSPGDFDGDGDLNAADNCRYTANPTQLDSSVPADGVGDACACGDTNETGTANVVDWVVLARALAQAEPGIGDPAKCSVVGGSMDCDAQDVARMRAALAGSAALQAVCRARVGAGELPVRMAVAGDSITRGFGASCECNETLQCILECAYPDIEQPEHSWFDGSSSSVFALLDRYRVFNASIGANSGAARSGARMRGGDDSFQVQAARILGQVPLPDFVVVLLGGNDICSRDCAQPGACSSPLLSDAEWRDAIGLGLSPLVASLPEQATVYLGSVPRVQDLYAAGQAKEDLESDVNCDAVWQSFDICRIATDPSTQNGETQTQRLAAIGARQRRYNEILREEALAYDSNANGQNPRGVRVVAEYTDELTTSVGTFLFGPNDINGSDCFHPSLQGQNAIAERLWRNSPVR
jgi:lysophospholipase L1-like esterase